MFNIEKFMAYMKETFGPMDNHFTYDTVENLANYAMQHKSHTKDDLCFFLSDIIAEVEFGEVAVFEDDSNLTSYGLEEKRKVLKQRIREAVDAFIEFEQATSIIYPFAVDEPTEEQRQQITEICPSEETEDIYEACEKILGINKELLED